MSAKKAASGITEKLLRDQGYAPNADGSWSKVGPASGNTGGGTNPQRPEKRKVEGQPRGKGQDDRGDRQGVGKFLVIATVFSVRPRDYDGLGAAVKAILDRLVELRRIPVPDDSPEFLEVICDWEPVAHFKDQRTTIEVWKLPDQQTAK
jgi:hypothetical protein